MSQVLFHEVFSVWRCVNGGGLSEKGILVLTDAHIYVTFVKASRVLRTFT